MNRLNQTKILMWMLSLCMAFALASCESDVHESEHGGLSVELEWQDAVEPAAIKSIYLWIYNAADGTLVKEQQFSNARQLASERYQLPTGNYKVVAAVNLDAPFSASGTTGAETLLFALPDASASPAHVYYAVADATVSNADDVTVVTEQLGKVMAELTLTVNNAPASSVLTGTLTNAAEGFHPVKAQTNDSATTVTFPSTPAQGTAIQVPTLRLMPTAYGKDKTVLTLQLTDAYGHVSDFDIVAPVMKAGNKYEITLDYRTMQARMALSTCVINPWIEGWTYNGEVLNPEN